MKRVIFSLVFALFIMTSNGQILYFGVGKTFSNFKYKDSQGTSLNHLKGYNQASYCVGGRYSLFYSPWHVSFDAMYNRYGAKGSDPKLGNYYEWDVTNLGANIGIDYEFFRPPVNYNEQHGLSLFVRVTVGADFLLDGTQNLNNNLTDLKGVEEFDKPFYFVKGIIGVNYYLSKTYMVFAQYAEGRSFLVGNYKGKEQLNIITHNISLGVAINLFYRK